MTVTLKDIADKSGVSIGTVNRALKNNGRISKETRDKVLTIAQEMNYIPNRAAQALVSKKSLVTIGFIYNGQQNLFYEKLLLGVLEAQTKYHKSELTIIQKPIEDFSAQSQMQAIDEILGESIDGLVIVPIHQVDILHRINQLIENNLPTVIIDVPSSQLKPLAFVYGDFHHTFKKIAQLTQLIGSNQSNITIITQSYLRATNISFFERLFEAMGRLHPQQHLRLLSLPLLDEEDYPQLLHELQDNTLSDIIICGGSKKVIETLYQYKTLTNNHLKVIALDYDYHADILELNQTVSFSINQNTHQLSYHAVTHLYHYLSKNIQPTTEIVAIESQIMINEY